MFGFRDEAGGDSDVTIFFTAERSTVLELSAFSFLSMRFRTGSIIDSQNGFSGRFGGRLATENFKADGIELIDIPCGKQTFVFW